MPSESQLRNLRHGQKVARNSMFLLIGLTFLKAFGGYISNALSLLGDAAASFGDMMSMIAIYIGLTLSLRPPSKRFRYGYHRIETFITLLIAGFTTYFGYRIGREGIARLWEGASNPSAAETELAAVGIFIALVSIGISLFAWRYQEKIALKINSHALLTSSQDKRNDAFITSGVLIGLVTNAVGFPSFEKFVAIGISLLVLFTGLKEVKASLLYLFDYWDDPNITNQIKHIIQESKIVTGIKRIRLRHAGTFIFGEAFLKINPFTDSNDLREEIHRLDHDIKKRIPHLGDFILYLDPPNPQRIIVAIPIQENKGLSSEIASEENQPFSLLLAEIHERKIAHFEVPEKTFLFRETASLAKFLKEKKVNVFISSHLRTLLYYPLRFANIRIYPQFLNVKDAAHTIKLLLLDYF